ncbi:MAG: hypothetical protein DMF56_13350 [Acidobacteria bacterium]|nr:MAG: hypothetical protein DMF56_13350 [Acidobacteriota bacterium]
MREIIEQLFPRLRESGFEITSPPDPTYNCVAWAAGDITRWWWPAESPFSYWPAEVRRDESVASFLEAFATIGYEITDSGDVETTFEKVAVFASSDGIPTHVARQLIDGTWTSKLGRLEDIGHTVVNGVSGSEYGNAVLFLKRRILTTA